MKPEYHVSHDLAEVLRASYKTAAGLNQSVIRPEYILYNAVGRPIIAQVLSDFEISPEGLQESIGKDFKKLAQPKSNLRIPHSESRRLLRVAMNEAYGYWTSCPVTDTSHVVRAALKSKSGYRTITLSRMLGSNKDRFLQEMLRVSQQSHFADPSFRFEVED